MNRRWPLYPFYPIGAVIFAVAFVVEMSITAAEEIADWLDRRFG